MKQTMTAVMLLICLLLSGCASFLSGEYIWEQTHYIPSVPDSGQDIAASNYTQLVGVLAKAIEEGIESFTVSVAQYDRNTLEPDVSRAVDAVRTTHPIAAYAVSGINWQIGTSAGETVLVMQVQYLHDKTEIMKIQTVADNDAALAAIAEAMNNCDSSIVLRVNAYEPQDFILAIETYAFDYPQYVMETPTATVNIYPENGPTRVLEIRFNYVSGRDALRDMQQQVLKLFDASVNFVSVTENTREKYNQLYSLLVERFQKYTIETSITPAYSLLLHGVGDSRAFAMIFSSMCRDADLTCYVVAGTKGGKLWYWNIIQIEDTFYHVDLLRSKGEGTLRLLTDSIINEGYVWDFDAYPVCGEKQ